MISSAGQGARMAQTSAMAHKLTAYRQLSATSRARKVTMMAGSGRFFVGGEFSAMLNGSLTDAQRHS